MEGCSALSVIPDNMSVTCNAILVSHKTLEADRSSRMNLAGRYTDLRTESVTESVRKSGGDISVDACGIHYLHKVFRRLIIFGQNRIRVVGSETVNVFAGLK